MLPKCRKSARCMELAGRIEGDGEANEAARVKEMAMGSREEMGLLGGQHEEEEEEGHIT